MNRFRYLPLAFPEFRYVKNGALVVPWTQGRCMAMQISIFEHC